MRAILTRLAMAGTSLVLAACNGIGDGNTLQKLEIVPASTLTQVTRFETGGTYRLYQCLRDELVLQGTFDSGVVANFNTRATWTSSAPDKVQVSNRDIPLSIVSNGAFSTVDTQPYISGTVVPVGSLGDTATITATFAGLSASINVVIRKPSLRPVPVPHPNNVDPRTFAGPAYLGVGTNQRLALVGDFDGRFVSGIGSGTLNTLLNPVLWKFPGGEYRIADENPATAFDNLWVIPGNTPETPRAFINTSGTVRGLIAHPDEYEVEGLLSLCKDETDPDLRPATTVRVLPFDTTTPISFERQAGLQDDAGFMPVPGFTAGQMVAGTNQHLTAVGHLDVNDDGVGDVEQNLAEQMRFNFEPRDTGCDGKGLNCAGNSLFTIAGVSLSAVSGTGRLNDGFDFVCLTSPADPECDEETDPSADPVNIEACFPFCPPRLASLEITSSVPPEVTLKATHHDLGGTPTYLFNCGNGFAPSPSASDTVVCDYGTATGTFTPTVRILVDDHAVSVNAGAVQVSFDAAPGDNTPPTTTLAAAPTTASLPVVVFLTAIASDANAGDAVSYYEFQPDDGVVIRQSSAVLGWLYRDPPAANFPKVIVYDKFSTPSAPATPAIPVALTAPATPLPGPVRSAPRVVESVQATPCALRILPADAGSEQAFTFPGTAFRAIASFIADPPGDASGDCDTDTVIGTQDVTRLMFWAAHPDPEATEFSPFVTIRSSSSDFQKIGQAFYLASPTEDTTVTVKATPNTLSLLKDVEAPEASSLTVECLPPVCAP